MKIKFGAIIVDGSGKVGGQVIAKNKGGKYMRNKVTPTNPKSTAQVNQRNNFSEVSKLWRTLTDAQRAAWNSAAALAVRKNIFGDNLPLSGFQYFGKLNGNSMLADGSNIQDPPTMVGVDMPAFVSVTCTAGTPAFSAVTDPTTLATNEIYVLEATEQLSPGVSSPGSKFRVIEKLSTLTAGAVPILASYTPRFGALEAGKKIFLRASIINSVTGERSQYAQRTVTVG